MRGRGPVQSLAASPTMVGAVTTLILIVAVFLAYNANNGLPFVPVYRVSVEVPNAARMVHNNEVRIGGKRVGVVESVEAVRPDSEEASDPASEGAATDEEEFGGTNPDEVVARLNLKLDKTAEPVPEDSVFRIRYRSSFGLKYLEITRGDGEPAPEGYVFANTENFVEQTEFDDIANTFDSETRENGRTNLVGFGDAFAGRGSSLNLAIEGLDPLFANLKPVAKVLASPDTKLARFFQELADNARIIAPIAEQQAELFTNMAITFAAISSDVVALQNTISEGPPTLETGIRTLPRQRPFLTDFTRLSRLLAPGISDLRRTLPVLNDAIKVGTPVLRAQVATNRKLEGVLRALNRLAERPSTKVALTRLRDLLDTARPLAEYVNPVQTVCNYITYWTTFIPNALSDRDQVGYNLRQQLIGLPNGGQNIAAGGTNIQVPGAVQAPLAGYSGIAANGKAGLAPNPADNGVFKPYELPITHAPGFSGPTGQKGIDGGDDCQGGQTGYALGELRRPGQPAINPAFAPTNLPGSRGPTTLFFAQDGTRSLEDTRVPERAP
ncbi:MAG: MlaD family protein [Solirubrobacterales bacterium]